MLTQPNAQVAISLCELHAPHPQDSPPGSPFGSPCFANWRHYLRDRSYAFAMSGIDAKRVRTRHFFEAKKAGTPISALTSYDALSASIFDEAGIEALVNRQYLLSEDYVPRDMVAVEVPLIFPEHPEINQLRAPAADALKQMFATAEEAGIILYARSGYRSYGTQERLYGSYVETHGEEAASRFSAPPGASEHQTGLAMDVTSESVGYELLESFGETAEGEWVKDNAHVYGFIIRYHEGKEDITGYMYEPWHLRYVGKELAHDIKESGLTYEEYIMESGIDIEEN